MKRNLLCFALAVFCSPLNADEKSSDPGLIVNEYPHHDSQTSSEKTFIEPAEFGRRIGKPFLIESLERWKHGQDRNAIASGLLIVPKTGTYSFRADSYYDRNMLIVDGEVVCPFRDGTEKVGMIELVKGAVPIESVGYVNGRGQSGILVEWKPPGQREFGPIPAKLLRHEPRRGIARRSPYEPVPEPETQREEKPAETPTDLHSDRLTLVAKDFVIELYHNGRRLNRGERRMALDRFGSTVERVDLQVRKGDWLVFHVAHNRLRHGGRKYFGVLGHLGDDRIGFVSEVNSENWSVCDSSGAAHDFIHFREAGTEARAVAIAKPWEEGRKFMEKYSGMKFTGEPVWGTAPSTWIKYTVPE